MKPESQRGAGNGIEGSQCRSTLFETKQWLLLLPKIRHAAGWQINVIEGEGLILIHLPLDHRAGLGVFDVKNALGHLIPGVCSFG